MELGRVEHAEPGGGDDGGEAFEEGGRLVEGLEGEAVAGHVGDVDEAVGVGDGGCGARGAEGAGALDGFLFSGVLLLFGGVVGGWEKGVCDFEGETQAFDVS